MVVKVVVFVKYYSKSNLFVSKVLVSVDSNFEYGFQDISFVYSNSILNMVLKVVISVY